MTAIDAALPKKERILIAAEDVFSRRGYAKATLDEIIGIADTGKGTLYKYFGNKDNLFYTLIERRNQPFIERLKKATAAESEIPAKLYACLYEMLKFLRVNKELWRIIWYELNAVHQGVHPALDESGNWKMASLYGADISPEEERRLLRYYSILWEEVYILAGILQKGQDDGFLKTADAPPVSDMVTSTSELSTEAIFSAYHLFAGIANGIFHVVDNSVDDKKMAESILDYFLNGHAAKA